MKKGIFLTLAVAGLLGGCGEKFTPLSEEQIKVQVDSAVTAQKATVIAEKNAACDAGMAAAVSAKVEALKAAETASN